MDLAPVPHINRQDLQLVKNIGEGGFGSVYHMIWKSQSGDLRVAAKRLYKVENAELDILPQLKHPNVVRLIGVVPEELDFMLVLELCENGSLRFYLDQNNRNPLPTELFDKWAREAAKAIRYLHQMGIVHKDVKSQNYLISGDNILKLGDLGLAEKMAKPDSGKTGEKTTTQRGSWTHMAPELQHACVLSPKFDIFAFGVVLWEMLTGQVPYEGMGYPAIIWHVCRENKRLKIPQNCPPHVAELMVRCWQGDQTRRADIDQVLMLLSKPILKEEELKTQQVESMIGSVSIKDQAYSSFLNNDGLSHIESQYVGTWVMVSQFGHLDDGSKAGDMTASITVPKMEHPTRLMVGSKSDPKSESTMKLTKKIVDTSGPLTNPVASHMTEPKTEHVPTTQLTTGPTAVPTHEPVTGPNKFPKKELAMEATTKPISESTSEPMTRSKTRPTTKAKIELGIATSIESIPGPTKPSTDLLNTTGLMNEPKSTTRPNMEHNVATCRLYKAGGIAVNNSNGDIAISDIHTGLMSVWDMAARFKFSICLDNKIPQSLKFNHYCPQDVAVGPETSNYFITDFSCFVQIYDSQGQFKDKFPAFSAVNKPCCSQTRLTGLVFDNDHCLLVGATVYAADNMVSFISKHTETGEHIDTIPLDIRPQFLAVTPLDTIMVTTWSDPWTTNTIHIITNTGQSTRVILPPLTSVRFWRPAGICCTTDTILVANDNQVAPYEYGVYCFSLSGDYIGCATKEVINPTGIAVSDGGKTLIVAQYEKGNHLEGCGVHGVKIFGRK